jgi:hypothetical protein
MCPGFEARRSAIRIRRSDPEAYQLAVTVRGRSGIRQEDRQTALTPTDLVLYDASRPFLAWSSPEGRGGRRGSLENSADGLILQVPHNALAFPAPMVRRVLAMKISGRDGVGALLSGLLHHLVAQAENLSGADLERLSGFASRHSSKGI